ncbi:MAG: sigma-54 dependent transcriptional regulator [bacterium]|nr:sigma-54 dependent transcriptional regulator [bacterium]
MAVRILVVDDEPNIRKSIKGLLEDKGYELETVATGEDALFCIEKNNFDIVLLDIVLPGIDGIQVLEKIKQNKPYLPVVMISGQATIDNAVKATKLGAYDFLEKPIIGEKLLLLITHLLEHEGLKRQVAKRYTMVGSSNAIKKLYEELKRAAQSNSRVLIHGESGTGKELVARAIHDYSPRKTQPFITVNCAALPKELIESELFGYEKGAFTGAITKKEGKFILANTGTLFLDEVGDMSLETQAKLLRVLEEGEIEPLGGKTPIKVDVRVISATNKNLEYETQKGNFRQDLLFRINVIPIFVPPLRERIEDIGILSKYFIKLFCEENGKRSKDIESSAIKELEKYNWPGNVRELKNLMERLVIMVPRDTITVNDVVSLSRPVGIGSKEMIVGQGFSLAKNEELSLRQRVDNFERTLIQQALIAADWNIKKAAAILKTDRANLYRKIREYGLTDCRGNS